MGTFGCYTGSMSICEEKRELFCSQVEKILNYGGMCEFEEVNLYGRTLNLLKSVKLSEEYTEFYYNYFEDAGWETASFDSDDTYFLTEKIGNCEFCDVVTAVYMLYELYGDGLAMIDGDVVNSTECVGWINNLLGTEFSMEYRFNVWKYAEEYAFTRLDYECVFTVDMLYEIIPEGMIDVAGGTELADILYVINGTETLSREEVESDSYAEDVLNCKQLLEEYFATHTKSGEADIIKLICMARELRADISGELKELAALTMFLPARVFAFLTAELKNKEFWNYWAVIYERVYNDEEMKLYESGKLEQWCKEQRSKPIKPVRTSDYLKQTFRLLYTGGPEEVQNRPNPYLTDADRLYWWDGTSEVEISEETDSWLKELSRQYIELLDGECDDVDENIGNELLRDFLQLLSDIDEEFGRIFPFCEMFYDFLQNITRKEYRAAVGLIRKVAEENKKEGAIIKNVKYGWGVANRKITHNIARLRLKRVLSVMANLKLREMYFGF